MTPCFLLPCPNAAEYVVSYKPCCRDHVLFFLDLELNLQPDGRPGATMIPVGLIRDPA